MAYQFAGFFCMPPIEHKGLEIPGVVWRDIAAPFRGTGVRVKELVGKTPEEQRVLALGRRLGILESSRWIYIDYECWAGEIDAVYGFGVWDGAMFGPIREEAGDRTKAAYLKLFAEFRIAQEDALRFPAFERGFWGEA